MRFNPESPKKIFKNEVLPEDHWFKVAEKLYKESGEVPDPLQIRAAAIIEAFGIPSSQYSALGPYSAFGVDKEGKRIRIRSEEDKKKDKIIAKYLTNKPGVLIDKETGIASSDFRDMYPKGLPEKLKEVLDPATKAIMETEYKHTENVREKFGNTENILEADCLVNYFRLPGGIDLFLRGYAHDRRWQENHGQFLQEANKYAKVICIEGFTEKPFGVSIDSFWSNLKLQGGHYDILMKEAVDVGFKGLFTEIDARDESKINMDRTPSSYFFPELPPAFFDKYFDYLQRESPSLTKNIGSPENLKQALTAQSTTNKGLFARDKVIYWQGKCYDSHSYLSKEGRISFEPTFLELGQKLFSDSLAAVKLHLIAKLMSDRHIEKGPIIDYEGDNHLSSKSFFLRQPKYAMEVVLRNPNELMAGRVKEKGNIPEIYKVFENPNWQEIVKEIAKLSFKEVENDPSKTTALGPNQRKLLDKPIDFLKTYNINPEKVIPSDEKIKEIREKFQKLNSDMRHPTE